MTLLWSFGSWVFREVGLGAMSSCRCLSIGIPLRRCLPSGLYVSSLSLQNDVYEWSRDHRVHHKFSETDADPHNARRGFFFSHVGWLLVRKHPAVKEKGALLDLSDLKAEKLVMFQRR